MFVKINGETHYLRRAVDYEGEILESYVTKKRDKKAALKFLRKALKRHVLAESIVTDGLNSYPAAMRELSNENRREMGRWKNNQVENPHIPLRREERVMQRFRRMKSLQNFANRRRVRFSLTAPFLGPTDFKNGFALALNSETAALQRAPQCIGCRAIDFGFIDTQLHPRRPQWRCKQSLHISAKN